MFVKIGLFKTLTMYVLIGVYDTNIIKEHPLSSRNILTRTRMKMEMYCWIADIWVD